MERAVKTIRLSRTVRTLVLAAAILAALWLALNWPRWQLRGTMATGYGSRMACSCRYIAGRDLKSCQSDFKGLEGMGLVRLSDDPAGRTVTASIPLLSTRKAVFKPGYGCLPDRF